MAVAKNQEFTYGDLMRWDDGKRYELYNGQPELLASPSPEHQKITGKFAQQFNNLLEETECEVYLDVDTRLFQKPGEKPEDQKNVVRPDVMVLCDSTKRDNHGIAGAPDLVVEILSDSTKQKDLVDKFRDYARAGVPEYWIADPRTKTVSVFTLNDGQYDAPIVYTHDLQVPFPIASAEALIDLHRIFR